MSTPSHFLVTYRDPERDETVTIRARTVTDSQLGLSFLSISDFVWIDDARIVNPQQEALRERFKNVRALHLSIHRVLSVVEVGEEHRGLTFDRDRSNLVVFPTKN